MASQMREREGQMNREDWREKPDKKRGSVTEISRDMGEKEARERERERQRR